MSRSQTQLERQRMNSGQFLNDLCSLALLLASHLQLQSLFSSYIVQQGDVLSAVPVLTVCLS